MDLSFTTIFNYLATYFFDGSTTLAGLAILVAAWILSLVVLINIRAPPTYSVVPMIPLSIFMSAYGVLDETVTIFIVIVSAAMVASQLKSVVG
jgi:hypothetical protein